jgi:dGTPase
VEFEEVREALGKGGELGLELLTSLDNRHQEITAEHLSGREKKQFAYQHFRAEAMARFADSCERTFVANIESIEAGEFRGDLITASDCAGVYSQLKSVEDTIFLNPAIVRVEKGGKVAVHGLLGMLYDEVRVKKSKLARMVPVPPMYTGEVPDERVTQVQRVVDYVSGMTDRFAVDLYQQLSGSAL